MLKPLTRRKHVCDLVFCLISSDVETMYHFGKRTLQRLSSWITKPEFIPVYALASLMLALYLIHPNLRSSKYVFEPPCLLFLLNAVLLTGISFLIAYLSLRVYLWGGFVNVFLLGCGALVAGSTSLVAGWVIGEGMNYTVTINNIGILCAAVFYCISALSTAPGTANKTDLSRRRLTAFLTYIGIIAGVGLLTAMALDDLI
jgi:hypothetical protein